MRRCEFNKRIWHDCTDRAVCRDVGAEYGIFVAGKGRYAKPYWSACCLLLVSWERGDWGYFCSCVWNNSPGITTLWGNGAKRSKTAPPLLLSVSHRASSLDVFVQAVCRGMCLGSGPVLVLCFRALALSVYFSTGVVLWNSPFPCFLSFSFFWWENLGETGV